MPAPPTAMRERSRAPETPVADVHVGQVSHALELVRHYLVQVQVMALLGLNGASGSPLASRTPLGVEAARLLSLALAPLLHLSLACRRPGAERSGQDDCGLLCCLHVRRPLVSFGDGAVAGCQVYITGNRPPWVCLAYGTRFVCGSKREASPSRRPVPYDTLHIDVSGQPGPP